jgi:hypothetical protein
MRSCPSKRPHTCAGWTRIHESGVFRGKNANKARRIRDFLNERPGARTRECADIRSQEGSAEECASPRLRFPQSKHINIDEGSA